MLNITRKKEQLGTQDRLRQHYQYNGKCQSSSVWIVWIRRKWGQFLQYKDDACLTVSFPLFGLHAMSIVILTGKQWRFLIPGRYCRWFVDPLECLWHICLHRAKMTWWCDHESKKAHNEQRNQGKLTEQLRIIRKQQDQEKLLEQFTHTFQHVCYQVKSIIILHQ